MRRLRLSLSTSWSFTQSGWLALHILRLDTAITIFVFGAVMGIVFEYSESLWAPIVTHSTNDFLSFVLFRL